MIRGREGLIATRPGSPQRGAAEEWTEDSLHSRPVAFLCTGSPGWQADTHPPLFFHLCAPRDLASTIASIAVLLSEEELL